MPDFTVPPGWEGPLPHRFRQTFSKSCMLANGDVFELLVIDKGGHYPCCALCLNGRWNYSEIPMKSVQAAFDVAEAIIGALWLEADHA